MEPVWALVFLAIVTPFAVLCAVYDLTRMKIPNWVVAGLALSFLALCAFAFSPPEIGLRLVQAAVMFGLGYLLNTYLDQQVEYRAWAQRLLNDVPLSGIPGILLVP